MNRIEAMLKCLLDNLEEGVHIVDHKGRTIYYNTSMEQIEGLKSENVIGKKVSEYLKGVEEESSTLMNALKNCEKYMDVIQHYSSHHRKEIITINTTFPVVYNDETIAAIEISKDMTRLKELNEKICRLQASNITASKHYTFKDIVGDSQSLRDSVNKAVRASLSSSSVLIYGETGCGKELFAQSIHFNGIRKDSPFIPINCAAIPSSLLEAMLFGTVKGSFTGAENKKGLLEEANGGTILLDEINSMELSLQSKLLRVLQEGYVRPIGSSSTIDIDIRIIATLNEEPEKLIREGKLRKDLYYRLSVIRIDVPALRDRKEDIIPLSNYFIKHYNKLLGKNISGLDDEVINTFLNYDWPGNVRELRNTIESAMNMMDLNIFISKEFIDNRNLKNLSVEQHYGMDINLKDFSLDDNLEIIEKTIIMEVLKKFDNNITKSSEYLKISRQNLQYKIKKYKLL